MKLLCIVLLLLCLLSSCAMVKVTPTTGEIFPENEPEQVAILLTIPRDRPYREIAAVTVTGFEADEAAAMHKALRKKAAPFGAEAVIILNQGITEEQKMWATAVCIRWQ